MSPRISILFAYSLTSTIVHSAYAQDSPVPADPPAEEPAPAPAPPPAEPPTEDESKTAELEQPPDASPVRMPVAVAQRPLTTPKKIIVPSFWLDMTQESPPRGRSTTAGLGASLGITDDFSVGITPLQIKWPSTPGSPNYYDPSASATYRLANGSIAEIGMAARGRLYTEPDLTGGALALHVPLAIHATDSLRFGFSPGVIIVRSQLRGARADSVRANFTSYAIYNFTETIAAGASLDPIFWDLSNSSKSLSADAWLTFTVIGKREGPVLDVEPTFGFPYLVSWDKRGNSQTFTDWYTLGLNLRTFLYL